MLGYVGMVRTPDADGAVLHTAHAVGHDIVGRFYSDGGSGILRGLGHMGINANVAQPELHDTKAIIVQSIQQDIDGTITLLVQAGLPPVAWAFAATCYWALCNIAELALDQDNMSGTNQMTCSHWQCFQRQNSSVCWISRLFYSPRKEAIQRQTRLLV